MGNTKAKQERKIDEAQKKIKRLLLDNQEQLIVIEREKARVTSNIIMAHKKNDIKAKKMLVTEMINVNKRLEKNRQSWQKLSNLYNSLNDDLVNVSLTQSLKDVTDVMSDINRNVGTDDVKVISRNFIKENKVKERRQNQLDSVFERTNGDDEYYSDDEDEIIKQALQDYKEVAYEADLIEEEVDIDDIDIDQLKQEVK